ncbi:hypothetical protein E1A91_A05G228500v1 [Gossypium mustelinum]|uniref:Uncharacterized protein n=2 Tax=Gossypium TaxID=3633 RepID=A0A5D2Z8I1_GOSMU|nr:hypothetical protein ES332_A05G231500v1 [Gossypium tomentosum]TYJ35317.1 hypothetical protein E1A91_A05G228500v1 [Gossypium mustelinum]
MVEIHEAEFEQNGDKAPGSEGYTAHFFKVAWHIVKANVTKECYIFSSIQS